MSGRIAPLYIDFKASLLSPHFIFADFDSACIIFVHLFVVCIKWSLKFILLSMIIPKYLILFTCSSCLLFMYIATCLFSFRFLLVISIAFDLLSLKLILLFF